MRVTESAELTAITGVGGRSRCAVSTSLEGLTAWTVFMLVANIVFVLEPVARASSTCSGGFEAWSAFVPVFDTTFVLDPVDGACLL